MHYNDMWFARLHRGYRQTPSFNDINLRGFLGGFSSGQYALLVPFYNALFNGKVARLQVRLSLWCPQMLPARSCVLRAPMLN